MRWKRKNRAARIEPPSDFLEAPVELFGMTDPVQATLDLSRTPTRVGSYLLLERLGSGGMAEVYLARKEGVNGFEKDVALKCVLPRHLGDQNVNAWFEREAKLGSRLNHANIAQIYDFTRENDSYWLVMEYVHGRSLDLLLKKADGPISVAVAVFLWGEVLKALEYAHHRSDDRSGEGSPVIHRDVTPKNIMISFQGEVKVVDFGIARPVQGPHSQATEMGMVKGTPGYMSPEQAHAELLDIRTDLYSACVVLYEMLAGKALFPKGKVEPTGASHQRAVARKLQSLRAPAALKKLLQKGLSWDRGLRFGSALEMRKIIEKEFTSDPAFGPSGAAQLVSTLFATELEEEKRTAEAREARLEGWRARGLSLPAPSPLPDADRWKRSPLILVLLVITVLTTFLNLYLQLAPEGFPFGRRVKWNYRAPASQGGCFVSVESVPSGAALSANGIHLGRTPATFRAKCGEQFQLQLESEGFQTLHTDLTTTQQAHQLLLQLRK